MNWLHIVGFLLMLSCFLTVFENFGVALLLLIVGAVVFQCGIDKAVAIKREEAEKRWQQILHRDSTDSTYTPKTDTDRQKNT